MSLSCLNTFECGKFVYNVVFSSNGELLAISHLYCIRIWRVATGELLRIINSSSEIWCVAFCPSGDCMAVGLQYGTIQLWNVITGTNLLTLTGHDKGVSTITFLPHDGGRTLASASYDKTARIWDVATGACLHVLRGHNGFVNSIVYSSDGGRLVTGSSDKTIKVWDAATGTCLATFELDGKCYSVAFLPDDQAIVAGSGNEVRLLNPATGAILNTLQGHTYSIISIFSMAVSPCSNLLVTGSINGTIKLWDLRTSTCLATLERLGSVAMSLNGCVLATSSIIYNVQLWDLSELLPEARILTIVLGGRRRRLPYIPPELWGLILDEFY